MIIQLGSMIIIRKLIYPTIQAMMLEYEKSTFYITSPIQIEQFLTIPIKESV